MRTVLGLFDDVTEAQRAFQELVQLGFAAESIGIVTNASSQRALAADPRVNLRSLDIHDVGRIMAGGPMREVLAEGNGGANLSATLRRYGIEGELAERYVAGVRNGETLEAIIVEDRDSMKAYEVMRRHSHVPQKVERSAPTTATTGGTTRAATSAAATAGAIARERETVREVARERGHEFAEESRTIPIVREELRVGKREVETGAVRADVRVVERPVSSDVNLREEHIVVERRAVDRPIATSERPFEGGHIEMHEYAEQAVAAKDARIVEEVVIRKLVSEHVERVSDKIRNTEIDIERPFEASSFRKHFDALGLRGERFEEYTPAYRLGHDLRNDARAKGTRWEDLEPRVRQTWETKHPGTWEKFKESIKHAFTR